MKILVCGGRWFDDEKWLEHVLNQLDDKVPITCVVNGGASGADTLGAMWASHRDIQVQTYPANWQKYGKAAGHIRNQQMLDEAKPELVVAFPGGKGTLDMMTRAEEQGFPVFRPNKDDTT